MVRSRMRSEGAAVMAALLAVAAIACGGGSDSPTVPSPTARVLTTVTVTLSPNTIQVGEAASATAAGFDQTGAAIATGPVTWSSGSPTVATVSGTGNVTSVAPGQTSISATVDGKTGSATLTVTAPDLAACRLPARFSDLGLGLPRVANRLPTVGTVRLTVLFVDFADAVSTRTPQSAFAVISPGAEDFYRVVSYGKMNLIFEPHFAWLRMSKPSTGYGWSALTFAAHKAYIQEAINLAGASVDFSRSDGFVIISNPDAGALTNGPAFVALPGSGVTAGGKTFENGSTSGRDLLTWGAYWVNHEMGHTMGLPDLYAFNGSAHRFVGGFSLMGLISGAAREYFAWERWLLGWVADAQVLCAKPGTTSATLSPVELAGGTKLVVVPNGLTTAVVVESRRTQGYDTSGITPGVLVYYIDTSIASGNGVLKVLPINDADTNKGTAPLGIGRSLTFGGVTVTFVSQDAAGDHVRVVR